MRRDRRRQSGRHATRRAPEGRSIPQQRVPVESRVLRPGDAEAEFEELYGQHHDAVLSHVLRLTRGDQETAEEVVKETFQRAWLDPHRRQRRAGAVRPWLLLLARAIHAERRGLPPPAAPVAEGTRTTVVAAIDSLSSVHRGVLVDLFYRGLSIEEVAVQLGVPPHTVRTRLFYAMRALRMVLQQQERT